MDEIWAVEFDTSTENCLDSRAWHIDHLSRTLISNYECLINKRKCNWLLVAIASSYDEAKNKADAVMKCLYAENQNKKT